MRFEEARGVRLPKVGFGTWSIGGGEAANRNRDKWSLDALSSALALGYTHFDTAELYAVGHCEELLGRAMREVGVDRAGLFITTKVKPEHLAAASVLRACDASLRRLDTDYIDLYLIHWPNRSIPLQDTFEAMNQLTRTDKVHHVGVSNFDLELLKRAEALSASPLLTNQVPMSLSDRTCVRNGVLEHCRANHIALTAYTPVKQSKLRTDPAVGEIAVSRGLTPHQVAIAWLCTQPGVITIPMSADPVHQRQNLEAADILLTHEEMHRLG